MKNLIAFFLVCLFSVQAFSQIKPENPDTFLFRPFTHSSNFKSSETKSPAKSFYQSKSDWQTIIDTTWGPGRPLNEKLTIFDDYTGTLTAKFAGFTALGIDPAEWDSIKASYRSRIDSSTSEGAFAALMDRLTYDLHDIHAQAWNRIVLNTPLNPGVPILVIGNYEISHFGAVLTVSSDSSILVLNVVDDHPLGLQPGDIVLGYEGIPWKVLVDELLGSGIPMYFMQRNSKSAIRHNELASAGMNWHLFETIDIVKYTSGDTVHLPVSPLINLPVPTVGWMWLNEQLPVPGVPSPDPNEYDEKKVFSGIVEGTNIGYIYILEEYRVQTEPQLYEAVKSLSGTEGLIIDLRLNLGGSPVPKKGLDLLFNSWQDYKLETNQRCSPLNFSLCPTNYNPYIIEGDPMSWYDRPLAVLTGPNCLSAGDVIAYVLDYHPMAQFFGKSTCGGLGGLNVININNIPEWVFGSSYTNVFRGNDPEILLNRQEFPVDDNVWFDAKSAANRRDTVAQKAMDWIQNFSYVRNILVKPGYAVHGKDIITLTAQIINPNGHNLSVNARITSTDNIITDTVPLFDDGNHNDGDPGDGTWGVLWSVPEMETKFVADITIKDLPAGTTRSFTGVAKFTSFGPVVVDGLTYYPGSDSIPNCGDQLDFKVALRNNGLTASAVKVSAKVTSLDTSLAKTSVYSMNFADIAPGQISTCKGYWTIKISKYCPPDTVIPVKLEILVDNYPCWIDTISFKVLGTTNIVNISGLKTRIYPNPANDIINIEIDNTGDQEIEIELYSVSGQLIYRKEYKNNQGPFVKQIDLSGYAKGVYFLRIRQSGKVYNGKIIHL